jgi:hypothetical protein
VPSLPPDSTDWPSGAIAREAARSSASTDREALAAPFGGHLLRQREGGVVRDGAEQQADVTGEVGALDAAGEVPETQGVVLGAGRRHRRGPVGGEADGDDVALVSVSGEPRDGLSTADVPDPDDAVAVTAAREGAGAVA